MKYLDNRKQQGDDKAEYGEAEGRTGGVRVYDKQGNQYSEQLVQEIFQSAQL